MIVAYYLWRFASWVVSVIPPPVSISLAQLGGAGGYYIWPSRRRVARENFSHVLGKPANDPAVGRVARSAFSNFSRYLVELMRYPRIPDDQMERRVVIHETDEFRAVMQGDKPVIIVTAHFGNMDYVSAVAARRYRRFTLAAETIHPVQLFRYLARVRGERGVDLVPYDQAPRRILQALKQNQCVGFLIDFGVNNQKDIATTSVEFFGARTSFPAGPAILAQRSGAPIIVAHTYLDRDKRIHCRVEPPISIPRGLPREQAAQLGMQAIAHAMERFIRQHPEQWYMFRSMWPKAGSKGDWDLGEPLSAAIGSDV